MIRMQRFIPLPPQWGVLIILWIMSLASGVNGDEVAVNGH